MKFKKATKYYVVASQGILTMAMLCVLGFYIGYKINKDSIWPVLLAFIGVMAGLFSLITSILFLLRRDDNNRETE